MAQEQPVPLQTDTVSNLPGGGVRTVVATVLVNGVPTPVQMQVVAIADEDGVIFDSTPNPTLQDIADSLRDIRRLLGLWLGVHAIQDGRNPGDDGMGL